MAESPPRKKARPHAQKWKPEYSQAYPCFKSVKANTCEAFCIICQHVLNISHGGICDLKKHVGTAKHVKLANSQPGCNGQTSMDSLGFITRDNDVDVINAEVLFTKFIVENNLPIAISDNCGRLFKRMFPDSKIARKYGCGRTKTTAIIRTLSEDKVQTKSRDQ